MYTVCPEGTVGYTQTHSACRMEAYTLDDHLSALNQVQGVSKWYNVEAVRTISIEIQFFILQLAKEFEHLFIFA